MRTLLLFSLTILSCHGFVASVPARRPLSYSPLPSSMNKQKQVILSLRGGGSALSASAADYSDAARVLFGNVISPAAMLAGGLVPLSWLAPPLPDKTKLQKKLKCLYSIISVLSLASELMCIIYATVASNKLVETVAVPAKSVFELIQRDYELSWIATNVHFTFGLMGFLSLVGLRAFTLFPAKLNKAAAGAAGASLLAMISVVNKGVSRGDGRGNVFASSIVSLNLRYGVLLVKQIKQSGGVLAVAAIVMGVISAVAGIRALLSSEETET